MNNTKPSVPKEILPDYDPDDEDMEETPPDVIDILGFDPTEEEEPKSSALSAAEWLEESRKIRYN
jgi:hypothetical protein